MISSHAVAYDKIPQRIRSFPGPAALIAVTVIAGAVVFLSAGREMMALVGMVLIATGALFYTVVDFRAALAILAFAFPLEPIFFAWDAASWYTLSYLAIGLIVVRLALPGQRPVARRVTWPEKWAMAWLLWTALSLLWSSTTIVVGIKGLLNECGNILLLGAFYRWAGSWEDVRRWLRYFVVGAAVMALLMYAHYQPGPALIWDPARGRYIPNGLAIGTGVANHVFGRSMVLATVAAIALFRLEGGRVLKSVLIAAALFFAISAPLAWNRSVMVALLVAGVAWTFGRGFEVRRTAAAVAVAGVALMGAWQLGGDALLLRVEQTFGTHDLARVTSGRSFIWVEGWRMFQEAPLTGVGYLGFADAYSERTGDERRDDHNLYLQALAETGLIGGILFIGLIFSFGWKAWRSGSWSSVSLAWWASISVLIFAATLERAKDVWFLFALILLFAAYHDSTERSETVAPE